MYRLLLKLLPPAIRALVEMAVRIVSQLNTAKERKAFAEYVLEALKTDGSLTVAEWAAIGSKAGILRGRRKQEAA